MLQLISSLYSFRYDGHEIGDVLLGMIEQGNGIGMGIATQGCSQEDFRGGIPIGEVGILTKGLQSVVDYRLDGSRRLLSLAADQEKAEEKGEEKGDEVILHWRYPFQRRRSGKVFRTNYSAN